MLKLAILLATYNGEKYITELLASLLGQSYVDFTVYIHDDGSTDRTKEIIKEWSLKYPAKFVRLGGDAIGGAKQHFLWMLSQMIDADYYMFCDQDDVWLPDKVSRTMTAMHAMEVEHGENVPLLVFSDMNVTDEALNVTSESFLKTIGRDGRRFRFTQTVIDNPAAGCTMCFNRVLRDIVVDASGYDIQNIPMHDALLIALADIYGEITFLDEQLVYYRQTGHNEMGAKGENKLQKILRNLRDIFSGRVVKNKKNFVSESRRYAKELAGIIERQPDRVYQAADYDKVSAAKQLLEDYSRIGDFPKNQRIRFYIKNNFTRAHGTLWMLLWI